MKKYSAAAIVEFIKTNRILDEFRKLYTTDNSYAFTMNGLDFDSFATNNMIHVYPMFGTGYGEDAIYREGDNLVVFANKLIRANSLKLVDIDMGDDEGLYDTLIGVMDYLLEVKGVGNKFDFVNGSQLEFSSETYLLVYYNGLVYEIDNIYLISANPETTVYKEFICELTLWDLLVYAARLKNQ